MTAAYEPAAVVADDLTRLRWAMEPTIDASGRRLAFVASGPDADHDRLDYRVRIVEIADGKATAVGGETRTRRPRWSPSGRSLAVLADVHGAWQLGLVDDAGTVTTPVSLPGAVRSFDWSPDGTRIVCELATGDQRRRVWVVDLGTGESRALPSSGGDAWLPVWAPDGVTVAMLGAGTDHRDGTAVWAIDVAESTEPLVLTRTRGTICALAWSVDGGSLAYVGQKSDATPWSNHELWIVHRDGVERRLAPSLDRSIGQVVRGDDERGIGSPCLAWTSNEVGVLATFADGGTSGIAAFDLDGGWEPVVDGSRAVVEFDAAANGAIAFTWSDPLTPGEVSVRLPDGSERSCSDLAKTIRDEMLLAPTERITHRTDDGFLVDGWLTSPVDASTATPLVVQVHGGPHYPVGVRFSFDAQRFAGAGFAALRANPRGSQGYGAAFAAGIAGDWGGRDFRDLMGLVDDVVAQRPIDAGRLAIIGESYGGFMALWTVAHTDRFIAAVSENGISDLAAAARHNPQFWNDEMAATPDEDPTRFHERSPITRASHVRTPLLLISAANDDVSPITQSEAMLNVLRSHDADVELVTVPDEGHMINVFGRPSRRIEKTRKLDQFLAEHLHQRHERRDDIRPQPTARASS